MMAASIGAVVDGVVAKVNTTGFMLEGRTTWENISKYADPKPTVPVIGARVRCHLDRSGYVRAVETVNETPATYTGGYRSVAGAQQNATAPGGKAQTPEDRDTPSVRPDRETCITRQACLNSAIATLSSAGQMVEPSAALELAASYEGWVTR